MSEHGLLLMGEEDTCTYCIVPQRQGMHVNLSATNNEFECNSDGIPLMVPSHP